MVGYASGKEGCIAAVPAWQWPPVNSCGGKEEEGPKPATEGKDAGYGKGAALGFSKFGLAGKRCGADGIPYLLCTTEGIIPLYTHTLCLTGSGRS